MIYKQNWVSDYFFLKQQRRDEERQTDKILQEREKQSKNAIYPVYQSQCLTKPMIQKISRGNSLKQFCCLFLQQRANSHTTNWQKFSSLKSETVNV